jgi:hypothetical protein
METEALQTDAGELLLLLCPVQLLPELLEMLVDALTAAEHHEGAECGAETCPPTMKLADGQWPAHRRAAQAPDSQQVGPLRRDSAGGSSVANTAKPIDDGGARLLVEDDDLEGAVVVAVLITLRAA